MTNATAYVPAITLPGGVALRDYQDDTVDRLLNPPPEIWRDLAVLATGGGKCITPNTFVWSLGLRRFGDIWGGTRIAGPHATDSISAWYDDGERDGFKITTRLGLTIDGTPAHRLYIRRDDGFEGWCRLEDLRVGDYVAVGRGRADFGDGCIPLDEAYVLGLAVADACLIKVGTSWRLQFDGHPDVLDDRVARVLERWQQMARGKTGAAKVRVEQKSPRHIAMQTSGPGFGDLFESKYGFRLCYSHERKIPASILSARPEVIGAFLCGYLDGDGSVEDHAVTLTSTSNVLAEQVQQLLLALGVCASIRQRRTQGRPAWVVKTHDVEALVAAIGVPRAPWKRRAIGDLLVKRRNSNIDVVPGVGALLRAVPLRGAARYDLRAYFDGNSKRPSYRQLRKWLPSFPECEATRKIRALVRDHRIWDPVRSIETSTAHRIDCQVEGSHAFIGNGIVNHNTICFAAVLHHLVSPGHRGLVLAHREELLTQARDKIKLVDPTLSVELEQSALRARRDLGLFAESARNVVVGSVQSLHKKRREQFTPDAFDVVIVDEAHHATSDSYYEIFEYFGCMDANRRTRLIGVTATPNRTDGKGLGSVFQRIAATYGIRELVERGYLVPPRAVRVDTDTDISGVKMTAGDFNQGQLEEAVNTDARNRLILDSYRQFAAGRFAIVFTSGVQHAIDLAAIFTAAGFPSKAIYGAMDPDERKAALVAFDRGELVALMNFGVLTEGYDNPRVSCVILGRPTPSSLLLTQMVGRGLRLFDGKSDCVCIDVQDVTSKARCVSVPTLAGLPRNFNANGENVFKAKARYDSVDPRVASRAESLADIDALLARAAQGMRVVEVDLLSAPSDPVVETSSRFMWNATGQDVYRMIAGGELFGVQANTLGKWAAAFRRKDGTLEVLAIDLPEAKDAFAIADAYVSEHYDTRLLDRDAPWRRKKVSVDQINFMVRLGLLSHPGAAPKELTKGQASTLIDEAIAAQRRGDRVKPLYFVER